MIEKLTANQVNREELVKLKTDLEFASQELEIARAKDKTLNGKLKRQKEAIDMLTSENEKIK